MKVIFADLAHKGHTCNAVPYGSALVAAYALEKIGSGISVELTKKVDELERSFVAGQPGMVCFSAYLWNTELSLAVARLIKKRFSECIIVFGGPNYPTDVVEQQAFLMANPEIDFFVYREGEEAFFRLFSVLEQFEFDASRIKRSGEPVDGCHYYSSSGLVCGDPLPLLNPDLIPSPYLTGLCDRFLQEGHAAILQTTRGCPFICAYCQEGDSYFNPIRRYNPEQSKKELWYIAEKVSSPKLYIADSNFGMYAEDLEIAEELSCIQDKFAWPGFVDCISGKNNKSLVIRTAGKIKGGQFSAAIQSSDAAVLHNIKRQNISIDELLATSSAIDLYNTHSFSEIILALPGDTLTAHMKSVCDLIDAGIHVIRSHQFIMLPGAELSSVENRAHFGLETRFRVTPNTANSYELFGQSFHSPEIDEICVATDGMTFQDYLESRCFDLTIEIFYNNGLFFELHQLLIQQNISISEYVRQLHDCLYDTPGLAQLYDDYLVDTQELWETRDALEEYLQCNGIIEKYAAGEFGRNEQLAYKAAAFFEHMQDLIEHSYTVAFDLLASCGKNAGELMDYLHELKKFDLLRKSDPVDVDNTYAGAFHYDFIELHKHGYAVDPLKYRLPEKIELQFTPPENFRKFVKSMHSDLCSGLNGYVAVISANPKVRDYFRDVDRQSLSKVSGGHGFRK